MSDLIKQRERVIDLLKTVDKKRFYAKNTYKNIKNKVNKVYAKNLDIIENGLTKNIKEKNSMITLGSIFSLGKYEKPKLKIKNLEYNGEKSRLNKYIGNKTDFNKFDTITLEIKFYRINYSDKSNKYYESEFDKKVINFLRKDFINFDVKEDIFYIDNEFNIKDINKLKIIYNHKYKNIYFKDGNNNNYTDIKENIPFFRDFYKFIFLMIPFNEDLKNSIVNNGGSSTIIFKVRILGEHKGIQKPILKQLRNIKVKESEATKISNTFSGGIFNGKLFNDEYNIIKYVKENKKKDSCLYDCIINKYKSVFNKLSHIYKWKLTYENLKKLCNPSSISYEASAVDMIPFFKKFKLNFIMIDIMGNFEYIYKTDKINKHINPSSFYVLIHNNHAYEVNRNEHKLKEMLNRSIEIKDEIHNITIDNKYKIVKLVDDNLLVESYEELINIKYENIEEDMIRIAYLSDINKLFETLLKNNYEPNINFTANKIFSINFNVSYLSKKTNKEKIKSLYIYDPKQNEDNVDKPISNVNELNEYVKYEKMLYDELINNNNKSTYSNDFNEFNKYRMYPLTGSFIIKDVEDVEIDDAYDFCKAYTSCLIDLKKIPVFNSFDVKQKYDNHEIEDDTFYLCEKKIFTENCYSKLYMLMPKFIGFMSGEVVKLILDDINILSYIRPSKINNNNSYEIIKEIYKSNINIKLKKDILNILIGKLGKKYNTKSKSYICNTEDEAIIFDNFYNDTKKLDLDDKTYYIYTRKKNILLCDGFMPIYNRILDKQRIKMAEKFDEVLKGGGEVIALKIDCLFVSGYKFDIEKLNKNNFESIGKLTHEEKNYTGKKLIKANINETKDKPLYLNDTINYNSYNLKDEYDINEISNFLKNNNGCCIKSTMPGSGKTTSTINGCKKIFNKDEILIITPTKNLSSQIHNDHNIKCITLNHLLGTIEDIDTNISKYKIGDEKVFIFDEIYCYTPNYLHLIKEFIYKLKDGQYHFSMGDEYQLPPIKNNELNNINNKKEYMNNIINSIFNKTLYLNVSKRFTNRKDVNKLINIKKDIFENNKSVLEVCKKYLNPLYKLKDINGSSISYKNDTRKIINNSCHKDKKDYYKGLKLVCVKRFSSKMLSSMFYVNETYEITEITASSIKFNNFIPISREAEDFFDHFDYVYCRTAYSSQGCTIEGNIYIFDTDFYYSNLLKEWLWVCITRGTDLNKIYYYCGNEIS